MFCPKCGKILPDDAFVCDACGAQLDQDPVPADMPEPNGAKASQTPPVKDAFAKWARDQGSFCLIAKAVAVIVMFFYLLTAIVYAVTLITAQYSGGVIFTELLMKLLTGIVYGVIIWLLSDAVLYLQKLYQMKKKELKDR